MVPVLAMAKREVGQSGEARPLEVYGVQMQTDDAV